MYVVCRSSETCVRSWRMVVRVGVAGASCTLAIDDPTGDIAPLAVATGPSPAEHEGFAGPLVWVGRSDQPHVAGPSIGRVGADRARPVTRCLGSRRSHHREPVGLVSRWVVDTRRRGCPCAGRCAVRLWRTRLSGAARRPESPGPGAARGSGPAASPSTNPPSPRPVPAPLAAGPARGPSRRPLINASIDAKAADSPFHALMDRAQIQQTALTVKDHRHQFTPVTSADRRQLPRFLLLFRHRKVRSMSWPAKTAPALVKVSSLTAKCWVRAWMSRRRRWSGLLE
jgi:hypothetical protein